MLLEWIGSRFDESMGSYSTTPDNSNRMLGGNYKNLHCYHTIFEITSHVEGIMSPYYYLIAQIALIWFLKYIQEIKKFKKRMLVNPI